jgi:hypothetical protein
MNDEELLIGYNDAAPPVSPYAGMTDQEIYNTSVKTYLTMLAERTRELERLGKTTTEALAVNITLDILGFCY